MRVIAREVGGNFGTRNFFYPEFALVCWAARRVGRPVKWTCDRNEAFLSDYAGRDFRIESELALDAEGNFLGLRATSISNLGAYTASFVPADQGHAAHDQPLPHAGARRRRAACSPTRCRPRPIAAPAGPRPCS